MKVNALIDIITPSCESNSKSVSKSIGNFSLSCLNQYSCEDQIFCHDEDDLNIQMTFCLIKERTLGFLMSSLSYLIFVLNMFTVFYDAIGPAIAITMQ